MAEEMNNIGIEPIEEVDNTRLYIAMRKKTDGFRIAATEEEYSKLDKRSYNIEGIIIRNEENDTDLLIALSEEQHFFGDGPEDIQETDKRRKHYTNPSMTAMDGKWRTEFLLAEQGVEHSDDCALCYAHNFSDNSWLPSGGEMAVVGKYLDEANRLLTLIGGTEIQKAFYWVSTQYSKEYSWFMNIDDQTFGFWLSKTNSLLVRPVGDAGEYQATVTDNEQ